LQESEPNTYKDQNQRKKLGKLKLNDLQKWYSHLEHIERAGNFIESLLKDDSVYERKDAGNRAEIMLSSQAKRQRIATNQENEQQQTISSIAYQADQNIKIHSLNLDFTEPIIEKGEQVYAKKQRD
jgi:hypothetical protein